MFNNKSSYKSCSQDRKFIVFHLCFLREEKPAIPGVICLQKKNAIVSLVFLNNPNTPHEQFIASVQESNLFCVLTEPIIAKKEG